MDEGQEVSHDRTHRLVSIAPATLRLVARALVKDTNRSLSVRPLLSCAVCALLGEARRCRSYL